MNHYLQFILDRIIEKNPLHSKKVKKNISRNDEVYYQRSEQFFDRYTELLKQQGKSLEFAVDCYLKMIHDVNFETVQFQQTGKYSSTSFDEVNKRVYSNPEVMEYYMHGLLMSQFLWKHHYEILTYFEEVIKKYQSQIHAYAEVGGGHGLYISQAVVLLGNQSDFTMIDISESSLKLAKQLIGDSEINYIHHDIYTYQSDKKYDFITMGEVMEHVEDPQKLLEKLHSLLADDGKVFVTTPTNAPAIDHIYLFRNAEEIREIIRAAGFRIVEEKCIYSENLPRELLEELNISLMYVGVLEKNA